MYPSGILVNRWMSVFHIVLWLSVGCGLARPLEEIEPSHVRIIIAVFMQRCRDSYVDNNHVANSKLLVSQVVIVCVCGRWWVMTNVCTNRF